ncbi:hypothetical protein [Xanthomonas perforans]|uniref:hypothetical protein n=1 Tax=Xanthomonas perforans TaxID=442694 RepID=UPI001193FCE7|nr:hypothetical protein [Xanthomonas perforans]MDC9652796.1 hypothetical protein [Xanthomonas perforans]MDC9656899.1 hypothetical protein [Xanthomonas perforans]MDC9677972.1 hypothetical protein [Xanthomonas perforans]MDC9682226.1 hypothetical protein [Xanthomonas perforans]MDC9686445.1 hypothetical protein [Xanthomonas perforans]
MRNLCLSAIVGALLLSAGCSSQPSAAALESEAAPAAVILLGEVDLPKGATLDDFPSLLNAGGIPWEKVQEGRVQLEGSFDRPWSDGRSLAVAVDVLGRTTRLIVRAGDQPRLSPPAVCVRGVGRDAVASDISEAHPCK